MVGISFSSADFVAKIRGGSKTTTIRPSNPKREEQMRRLGLHLYYKQRTPQCSFIGYAWPEEFETFDLQTWLMNKATEEDGIEDGFKNEHSSALGAMREYFENEHGMYTRIHFRVIDKATFEMYRMGVD